MSSQGSQRFAFVERYLERYRVITLGALLTSLPSREPRRHLYDLVGSYPTRMGKGLRPALCIASCRAFGGAVDRVLPTAVAIELFHNAFLVHDDIEDGSDYRRDRPTLHAQHGIGIAVNVGDAMNVLSMMRLMDNLPILGASLAWQVFAEIEHMVLQSVEGQAMELGWIRDNVCDLTEADYLRMTLKKTCWYTCIEPCRIGALVARGDLVNLDRFDRFGYYMGAAFQIQDDILNLVGDRRKYGKEIGGDIWEGKRTLMLIHLLNHCNEAEAERLRGFLSLQRALRLDRDVGWTFGLLEKYGSIDYARSAARQLAEAAVREFGVAYADVPNSEDKQFLEEIVPYMVERDL